MEENSMHESENRADFSESTENIADLTPENEPVADNKADNELKKLQQEITDLKDKYLRQAADFDNFRKRTAKERLELIQTAGRDVISSLLEVVDDCNRAEKQLQNGGESASIKEGILLVFNKLRAVLQARGLKPMETIGKDFDPDHHEAITEIPAPTSQGVGKVIDEVEKGYYLNDKIIRFAKVVVGK
ncbi:MAG: nucleotide exchange factor GrpE [Flavitalea sp.]